MGNSVLMYLQVLGMPAVLKVDELVWFPFHDLSRVWYGLIQAVNIWAMTQNRGKEL